MSVSRHRMGETLMRVLMMALALLLGCDGAAASREQREFDTNAQGEYDAGVEAAVRGSDEFDAAIAHLTKAIQRNPGVAASYNLRGFLYLSADKYDQAIADETKAIALRPDSASAYCIRGNAYVDKGLYDRSIADQTKAIHLKPDYAAAYDGLGLVHHKQGRDAEAIADYREAAARDPNDKLAPAMLKFLGATS